MSTVPITRPIVNVLPEPIEPWQKAFREGLAPLLSEQALRSLLRALETDDPHLTQGTTTVPPPLAVVGDWPVEKACLIGFAGMAEGLQTVGEVEEFFARVCFEIDARLGGPGSCRHLLNWFDDTPRAQMRPQLHAEVERELASRAADGARREALAAKARALWPGRPTGNPAA